MLQPFDTQSEGIGASAWLRRNASGNCSILMRTEAGPAVYLYWHDNPAGPILHGPVGYSDGRKVRKLYRELPALETPKCRYCGETFDSHRPNVASQPAQYYHWECFNRAGYQDGVSQRQARFEVMERSLTNLLHDLQILSGEIVGPAGVSWQDVAGTAAVNAQVLADQLTQARAGNAAGFLTFPSLRECVEKA